MLVLAESVAYRNPHSNHRAEIVWVIVAFFASGFDGVTDIRCARLEV